MQVEDFGLSNVLTMVGAIMGSSILAIRRFLHLDTKVLTIEKEMTDLKSHLEKTEDKIYNTLARLEDKFDSYILKMFTDGKN